MTGTLFLVATPIGNLEDITYRAVRILSEVDLVACEDTRQTAKLLSHYNIRVATVSYHEHNEQQRSQEILHKLKLGEDVALVSDAGTPLVSDPGYRLVRLTLDNTISVVPVPGPSAILTALTASGFPVEPFYYAGFLSAKRTQLRKQLHDLLGLPRCSIVFYEAPHRLLETLNAIVEVFGPERPIAVARELTKLHEEVLRGPVSTIQSQFAARPSVKGEITIIIGAGADFQAEAPDDVALKAEVEALIATGTPRMDAIKEVARRYRLPKRDIYRISG